MKKRILSLIMTFVMVLSLFAAIPLTAAAANFTLTWPVTWNEGTPPAWAQNATKEEQTATIQAIYDEFDYQTSIGFNMGTPTTGICAWNNIVNVQFGNGDHTGNPWGQEGRRMGGIVCPFPGTAFSVKGNFAAQYFGVVPLGNETRFTDTNGSVKTVQMLNNGQLVLSNGTITRDNSVYAGSGAPAAVTTQFQKTYAESAEGILTGQRLSLGYATGGVQNLNGIYYQEFRSNETTGTAFIAGNANGAYVIAGRMFDAWVANYKVGSDYFAKTGIPTGNAYTIDGVTYQEFANGALVLKANGAISGPYDNNTAFTIGFDYQNKIVDGDNYYYLVADSTNLSAFNSGIAVESRKSTISPSMAGSKNFANPVQFSVTAESGRTTNYTVVVTTSKSAPAKDQVAAKAVNDMVANLPVQVFRNDLKNLQDVVAAYETLTPAQKVLVDMDTVNDLLDRIDELESGDAIRVTCVGDSITDGYASSNSSLYSYPAQMQGILGDDYIVVNCGVSGANVMTDRGYVYKSTGRYTTSMNSDPDIVIVALGTNDAGNGIWNDSAPAQFEKDYRELLQGYLNLPSKPVVMAALPTHSWNQDQTPDGRNNNNVRYTIPLITKVANELNVQLLDMYTWSEDKFSYFPDRLHPSDEGYGLMAQEYAKYVLGATEQAADISLDGIRVDGNLLTEFDRETRNYKVEVTDLKNLPRISAVYTTTPNKTVKVTQATSSNPTATVIVSSSLGNRGAAYSVTFVPTASGDVNENGVVDVNDVVALKNLILTRNATQDQLAAGDFNKNGALDVADILMLKNVILKLQ